MFCRGRLRNLLRFEKHVHSRCFAHLRWCYSGRLATTTFRATNVARKVVPLLQVFDGRSKTRNILPQQKNANSCDRALCYTGQLSAQRLLREKLSLRVVPCNITLRVPNDFVVSLSWKWMSFFHLYFFPRDFSPGFSVRFLTVPLLLFFSADFEGCFSWTDYISLRRSWRFSKAQEIYYCVSFD